MTAAASVQLDSLIAEARRRARRRRLALAVVALAAGGAAIGLWLSGRGGEGAAPAAPPSRIEAVERRAPIVEAGISAGVGWAMNGTGLWLTGDGGRTWLPSLPAHVARIGDPVARVVQVEFADRAHGWISAADVIGGVVPPGGATLRHMEIDRTVDGGTTWRWSVPPGCAADCGAAHLSFVDARRGFALVGTDGLGARLYATANGGATWALVARPRFDGPIVFRDARHGLGVGIGGGLYRTDAGGRSWRRVDVGPVHVDGVSLFGEAAVAPAGVGRRLVVETSADGGATWSAHRTPVPVGRNASTAWIFSAASPRDWFATAGRTLWTTVNAGRTWRRLRQIRFGLWSPSFTSPRYGWAIARRAPASAPVLVRTENGGRTWTPLAPPVPRVPSVHPKPQCGSSCRRP